MKNEKKLLNPLIANPMIDKIKQHPDLINCISDKGEENSIFAGMSPDIPTGNYVIIKVDKYYSSLKLGLIPPSIDCLVVVKCQKNDFNISLIELRNIKGPKGFTIDNIYMKFKTTLDDFMSHRFADIFSPIEINSLKLYFVTNPYRLTDISHRKQGTKMDMLLSRRPFKFRDRLVQLEQKLPNPIINNC